MFNCIIEAPTTKANNSSRPRLLQTASSSSPNYPLALVYAIAVGKGILIEKQCIPSLGSAVRQRLLPPKTTLEFHYHISRWRELGKRRSTST